jgi:hypothetical protein
MAGKSTRSNASKKVKRDTPDGKRTLDEGSGERSASIRGKTTSADSHSPDMEQREKRNHFTGCSCIHQTRIRLLQQVVEHRVFAFQFWNSHHYLGFAMC